ncbi:MAG: DUF4118 domain-containing protein [Clostridia bacterium]
MKRGWRVLRRVLLMVFFLLAASGLGYLFRRFGFPETNIVIAYLLAVVMTAWLTDGYLFGVLASIAATLAFNYFFTVPIYTLAVDDASYLVTFVIMTLTALITSMLTSHVKRSAREAEAREADTKAVYALMSWLTNAHDAEEMAVRAIDAVSGRFACRAAFLFFDACGKPEREFVQCGSDGSMVHGELNEEQRLALEAMKPPYGELRGEEFHEYAVHGGKTLLGVLRIPNATADALDETQLRLLHLMNETIALAMDRLHAMKQQMRLHEEAEQERYRGNLLRAISHDLRTPLTGIMGTSEMLMAMSQAADPRYALAEGIYRDADWLHALVENILSLTRLQEGKMVLRKSPEALEEVVGAAVHHFAKLAEGREVSVSVPEELLMVPMDAKLIQQVLVNLLDNAFKHTAPEQEISVTATAELGWARVCVADRGSGIRKEDLGNLFQPFYTSHAQRPDAVQGIGLGLSICDAIVRAHGGQIEARNRADGSGAAFTFTLPLEQEKGE